MTPPLTDDGWIEHGGGECPVNPGQDFQLRYRDGVETEGHFRTLSWERDRLFWEHRGDHCDIIAYRVVEQSK